MTQQFTCSSPEVSIILPCRNEEKSLSLCLSTINQVLDEYNVNGEIIVSDSSVDNSPNIAKKFNAVLIKHDKEGYGTACMEGFKIAKGKLLFLADPDSTYDFKEIPRFLNYLRQDYEFVIGNRFKGKIEKGAMPWLHKYIGNPMFSFILRVFFKTGLRDAHCGMKAITRQALDKLNLKTTGMEFASEMAVKAIKRKLRTKELPINYYKRQGKSKLKSFADGWRHLRFTLLYSPLLLFFIPGLLLFLLGLISMLWFYFGTFAILGIKLAYHPMFFSSVLTIVGYGTMIFALFAKTYAITHLGEESPKIQSLYRYVTIEKAGLIGLLVILLGLSIYGLIFFKWVKSGFGALQEVKNSIAALTLIALGAQTVFSSFMLSILGIKEG